MGTPLNLPQPTVCYKPAAISFRRAARLRRMPASLPSGCRALAGLHRFKPALTVTHKQGDHTMPALVLFLGLLTLVSNEALA